jgi:hypothetical protein
VSPLLLPLLLVLLLPLPLLLLHVNASRTRCSQLRFPCIHVARQQMAMLWGWMYDVGQRTQLRLCVQRCPGQRTPATPTPLAVCRNAYMWYPTCISTGSQWSMPVGCAILACV